MVFDYIILVTEDTPEKKQKSDEEHNSSEIITGNVIDISDGEEEYLEYSFRENGVQDSFR